MPAIQNPVQGIDLSGTQAVPGPSRLYLPQLDVMRFFAFLTVFFRHGLPTPDITIHTGFSKVVALAEATFELTCESGVALFFLLSAYLITELLSRERAVSGSVHLKLFYIRRALRIWPLYYLVLGLGLVVSHYVPVQHLSGVDIVTYFFFLKNWDIVFHGWNWNPIYVLWTVSAEEQFYLAWPFAQKVLNRRGLIALCVVAIMAIPILVFRPDGVLVRHQVTQQIFTFIYFPIGSLISLLLGGRRKEASGGWCLALLATGVAIWLGGSYLVVLSGAGSRAEELASLVAGRFVIILGTLSIFFAFFKSSPRWAFRPLIYLGKISYGLYVFHVLALSLLGGIVASLLHTTPSRMSYVAVHLTLAMALTMLVAVCSYEFYEKRFLVLKDRFAIVHSRAV